MGKKIIYDAALYHAGKLMGTMTTSDSEACVQMLKECRQNPIEVFKKYDYFSPEIKCALARMVLYQELGDNFLKKPR